MKKLLVWAVTAALVLSLGTTGALAAWGDGGCRKGNRCACGLGYVDQNGDGVCDNCAAVVVRTCGGCGLGYVDRNGDGICDNCSGICQTAGGGHHHGQGRHH